MRDFKTYQELEKWMQDLKLMYCKKCRTKTWHFKRGFAGLDGNRRWSCLTEEYERKK